MYSYNDVVSYSEVDSNLELTYLALVNYIQDVGCFHSDAIGYGLSYLSERKMGWYVTSYEIKLVRKPKYGEKICIATYPYSIRGMMARRKYTISSEEGEILAYADSQWILMDLENGKPARAPEGMIAGYLDGTEAPELEFEGDRIKCCEDGEKVSEFTVTENYIDSNSHMNNSFYIDVTRRYLPDNDFSTIRINYKKAALFGDKLDVFLVKLEDRYQVILKKDGEIYTVVEYK